MVEDIEKLEVEMIKKMEEMGSLLKEAQKKTEVAKGPGVTPKEMEGLEEKMQMLKEMQIEIIDKKTGLENALRETQEVAREIQELRKKPQGEIKEDIKTLQERAVEKKEALEKAIREMEEIKEKYAKKFMVKILINEFISLY